MDVAGQLAAYPFITFVVYMNLARKDYVCGGPNPNHLFRGGIFGKFGSAISQCDGTGVPAGSSNAKFVADSSDYTKFKRQTAYNKNYNDSSYGGYNNASYVDWMHSRRGLSY
jgi:hypothetical protein